MIGCSQRADPCGLGGGGRRPGADRAPFHPGVVEAGETPAAALARELMEEVGIEAEIAAFNRHVEALRRKGTEYGRILSSPRLALDG